MFWGCQAGSSPSQAVDEGCVLCQPVGKTSPWLFQQPGRFPAHLFRWFPVQKVMHLYGWCLQPHPVMVGMESQEGIMGPPVWDNETPSAQPTCPECSVSVFTRGEQVKQGTGSCPKSADFLYLLQGEPEGSAQREKTRTRTPKGSSLSHISVSRVSVGLSRPKNFPQKNGK